MSASILIAGVGNIFLGDDAFGVETARALAMRNLPEGVAVVDYGIRGFDLAYALLEPWDAVILIDTLSRGNDPGTLYIMEPDLSRFTNAQSAEVMMNPHGMDPLHVLHLALSIGEVRARVYLVGCEPEDFGDELEGRMGLSETVRSSVGEAVGMVEGLVGRILTATGVCHV